MIDKNLLRILKNMLKNQAIIIHKLFEEDILSDPEKELTRRLRELSETMDLINKLLE